MIHRHVYEPVDSIDENFVYCQDYDICLRLPEVTVFYHLPKPLYYYRHHKNSISCEKCIEQLLLGKQAIADALQRRGITDEYELEFQVFSGASLLRKPGKLKTRLTTASILPKDSIWKLPKGVNPNEFTNWALAPEAVGKVSTQTIERKYLT